MCHAAFFFTYKRPSGYRNRRENDYRGAILICVISMDSPGLVASMDYARKSGATCLFNFKQRATLNLFSIAVWR